MTFLKWYSISIVVLILLLVVLNKKAESSTIIVSGFIFIPILAYLVMG